MAVTYRAQVSVWHDSTLPRDAMQINPVFRDSGVTSNPTQLATDLANAVDSAITGTTQVEVKMYDVEGTKPVYPAGQYVKNVGSAPASSLPRELALCLSFYAGANRPRRRGRLFLPVVWVSGASLPNRPSLALRDSIGAAWVPILTGLGGVDVDWGVWSQRDSHFEPCSHWWVDDEWDVQRSRGLRATTRSQGDVSE